MKICFVLPRFSRRPIGGYKIVFGYANRLVEKGYEVILFFLNENTFVEYKVPHFLKEICSNVMTQIEPRWFGLNRSIKKVSALEKTYIKKINDTDVCVATGAETVEACKALFPSSKKVYLIQGFEIWVMDENEIYATYNAGFTNIVVSNWLKRIVDGHTARGSILVKNPIDLKIYRPIVPIEDRKPHTIGLLYHPSKHKGLKNSIEALRILQKKYEDLEVYAFGTSRLKEQIPGLVKYTRDATQMETVEIYNKVSVFMCSSIDEGYGLTGMEAMACGAILTSTDYDGVHEYAVDGDNCLLSPVNDAVKMASNVSRVFEDDLLRQKISKRGRGSLKGFGWEQSVDRFIQALR